MPRPPEQSFRIDRKGFDWNKEIEYCADVKKMQRWMRKHGYNRKQFIKLSGIGLIVVGLSMLVEILHCTRQKNLPYLLG